MPSGVYVRTEKYKLSRIGKQAGENNSFYNKHHSEESLDKMRNAHKDKVLSHEHKENISKAISGENHPFYGKHHSEESNIKNSEAHKGDKSYCWKGGITPVNKTIRKSFEMKEWKEAVYKRDNYTCFVCGDNKGGNLNAHHVKNFSEFPELRFDVDNGITLCKKCHTDKDSFHAKYGRKNNNIDQLSDFKRRNTNDSYAGGSQ